MVHWWYGYLPRDYQFQEYRQLGVRVQSQIKDSIPESNSGGHKRLLLLDEADSINLGWVVNVGTTKSSFLLLRCGTISAASNCYLLSFAGA